MGFNHAAAFLPEPPRPKFFPPFEGPVKGFAPNGDKVLIFTTGQLNAGKTEATLLDLQHRWLNAFFLQLEAINPEIPRDVAVEWVNNYRPKTAAELVASINSTIPEKLAFRLADVWEAE